MTKSFDYEIKEVCIGDVQIVKINIKYFGATVWNIEIAKSVLIEKLQGILFQLEQGKSVSEVQRDFHKD